MIIQNMRYDNIIGSEIVVESQVEEKPDTEADPAATGREFHLSWE